MRINQKNHFKHVITIKLKDELTNENIKELHELIDGFNECNEEERLKRLQVYCRYIKSIDEFCEYIEDEVIIVE